MGECPYTGPCAMTNQLWQVRHGRHLC